nr:uncharacterized protein LOC127307965 isoform X2 [Lolium perenne]
MCDETSASHSRNHASAYVPLRDNSMPALEFAELSRGRPGSEQFNPQMLTWDAEAQEFEELLSLCRPGSEQFTPQMLMGNTKAQEFAEISRGRPGSEQFDPQMLTWNAEAQEFEELSLCRPGSEQFTPQMLMRNTKAQEFAEISHGQPGSEQFNPQMLTWNAEEFEELSLGRPASGQFTPQMLMRNTEDVKGKRLASEVKQIKAKILRLNVASVVTPVGLKSAAAVLIRDGSTAKFMTASCFRTTLYMDPALLFAAACCEGIKSAVLLSEPTTIVLESHQAPLLEHLAATQSGASELIQLKQFLHSNPPYFIIRTISEESNGAACQLARHALQMEESNKVCKDPPDWLIPYLDQ